MQQLRPNEFETEKICFEFVIFVARQNRAEEVQLLLREVKFRISKFKIFVFNANMCYLKLAFTAFSTKWVPTSQQSSSQSCERIDLSLQAIISIKSYRRGILVIYGKGGSFLAHI